MFMLCCRALVSLQPKKAAGVLRSSSTWTLRDRISALPMRANYSSLWYVCLGGSRLTPSHDRIRTIPRNACVWFVRFVPSEVIFYYSMHSSDVSFRFPSFFSDVFGDLYFIKRFDANERLIWLCGIVVGPYDIPCEPLKSLSLAMYRNVRFSLDCSFFIE